MNANPTVPQVTDQSSQFRLRGSRRLTTSRRLRRATLFLAAITWVTSLIVLLGWALRPQPETGHEHPFTKLLFPSNAMAMSTAVCFCMLALAITVQVRRLKFPARRHFVWLTTLSLFSWSLAELIWFLPSRRTADVPWSTIWAYDMSPLTAASFLLTSGALAAQLGRPRQRYRPIAVACAVVAVVVNFVLLFAYLNNRPIVVPDVEIQAAFPTTLSFVIINSALLLMGGPRTVLVREFTGRSTTAVLLRYFLPITIGLFLVSDMIATWSMELYARTPELDAFRKSAASVHRRNLNMTIRAFSVYAMAIGVTLVIRQVARRIGRSVESAKARLAAALQELQVARDRAESAVRSRDLLLAQVNHELRTPLNHILGFCQLLQLSSLDEGQQKDVRKILSAGKHLEELINDILDYERPPQLELEDFEVRPSMEEIATSMQDRIEQNGNKLQLSLPENLGYLRSDPKRFRQILVNLLTNAAKFTKQGTISVSASRERDHNQDWIVVKVKDTGRGIKDEDLPKLFQPFAQILGKKDNPEGTGLGLAICKKFCQMMGGSIDVESSFQEGTTFMFRLPAAASRAVAAAGLLHPAPRHTAGSTGVSPDKAPSVLVIDDDPSVAELMRRFLEDKGFEIHFAPSGARALEVVKSLRPTVITLDVIMPAIDGWGILSALKNDAETADIPVIMVTIVDDRTKGIMLGATDYLTKPVDWDRLASLLRKHSIVSTSSVLVVDDDPGMRALCRRRLEKEGFCVVEAENGQAAFRCLEKDPIGVILLDLKMPVMDGFEFLDRLRRQQNGKAVPVIVLTAKELTTDERRRLNGGVQEILEKGKGNVEELMSMILRDVERYVASDPDRKKESLYAQDSARRG